MTRLRYFALLASLLLVPAFLFSLAPSWGDEGVPTSVGLLYYAKKNFKVGDWVLYKVQGKSMNTSMSTDYQRVQIGSEMMYRGEKCFWLETGWGSTPDKLAYSAVFVSEGIYEDDMPELRNNLYLRKMHTENDENGNPIAIEMRTVNPKAALPDLRDRMPKTTVVGTDTLDTPKGRIVCQVLEVTRTFRQARDTADSTMRTVTESKTRRWINPDVVPITGLIKEVEHKVYSAQIWPLGKPSTNFPSRVLDTNDYDIEMIDFGHNAKPQIADRIRDAEAVRGQQSAN